MRGSSKKKPVRGRLGLLLASLVMALAVPALAGDEAPAAWSRWGGPNQDFIASSAWSVPVERAQAAARPAPAFRLKSGLKD